MNTVKLFLEHKAYSMRVSSLTMTTHAGSGHPTSCLSAADLVAGLFFYAMRYDPKNPKNSFNDRFILSKGHASPILYAAWKEVGELTEADLETYRTINSPLEGHPTPRFIHSEAATGSLGIGLSIGAGMALTARLDKLNYKTYVLLGDGEIAEGSIWEAAEIAHHYKLNNLIAILDCNRLAQSDATLDGHHLNRIEAKWAGFGWKTIVIDGHDMNQIIHAFDNAQKSTDLPVIIIAQTFKGHGVAQAEDKLGFHGKAFSKEELPEILTGMEKQFHVAATFKEEAPWQPQLPKIDHDWRAPLCEIEETKDPLYAPGTAIATRKAFGTALAEVGRHCTTIVSLDGDVKNSTYAEIFESAHKERFFQCFIAEQNMVGMAIGMDHLGKIPFVSTFGSFMSRAHDQIRMAAIGRAALRLVGSHAGVSIGEDGPSQMALEDISLMRAIPDSVVLYPCDAISTHKLVKEMASYNKGISYLRTTRAATPVIYQSYEKFQLGGSKILRSNDLDTITIVTAGITIFEALKAYDLLLGHGIYATVIDAYSIKPLDSKTLTECGLKTNKTILTVEDHYPEGGLGEAVRTAVNPEGIMVSSLAVNKLPRSGKPEELLAFVEIDAAHIVKRVLELVPR